MILLSFIFHQELGGATRMPVIDTPTIVVILQDTVLVLAVMQKKNVPFNPLPLNLPPSQSIILFCTGLIIFHTT